MKIKKCDKDVGVVLCDCGGTLRDRLDFDLLSEHLSQLPAITTIKLCSNFCQQNACTDVIKSVSKEKAKRLVVGACDQEVFDKALREAMVSVGLNQGLLWCVNIREHCGWVTSSPEAATDKAIDVLTAAVRRVELATQVMPKKVRVNQDVLVLGGDVAAMQTAIALSVLGHRVTLVTKDESLGGSAAEMPELYAYLACDYSQAEMLVQNQVNELIRQVKEDRRIRIQTSSYLKSLEGEFGNFTVVVGSKDSEQKVAAGAIVLANPTFVFRQKDVGVKHPASRRTKSELARLLHSKKDIPKRIAIMIDILREQDRAVTAQVLSAAELLVNRFGVEVKLYCHNVRVAATGLESLYRRAREAGLVVVKFEKPPVILDEGSKKIVHVEEPITGYEVSEEFGLVITADALAANGKELLPLVKDLRTGPEGELQVDNVWFLPVKTNREGIFVVGSARGNNEYRDAQADGLAAANQIHESLKNKEIIVLDDAAVVDTDKCVLCLTCMRICPHGAVSIDVDKTVPSKVEGVVSISAVACQRCGICAAHCPAGAIQLPRYTDEQIAVELGDKPYIIVFACENSAFPAATAAGIEGSKYNASVRLIRVPCAGKVDPCQVLRALECGAEKVMILGCHLENCQYLSGSTRSAKRIERLNSALDKAGVDAKRVIFGQLASVEPSRFLEYVGTYKGVEDR